MLHNESAQIFIPDGIPVDKALERTTHLAVCAHQDDIEIMAIDGVLKCYQRQDQWFTGVVVTNGAGSSREGIYADYTDEDMQAVRAKEQFKAAYVGEYAAQYLLDYSSATVKDSSNRNLVDDLHSIFKATQPEIIYTHNLADKHPTHVAVVLRTIEALRSLPESERPIQLIGCEVWRDLGWMLDEDKVVFDTSRQENLQTALVGIFDSQVSGGKRYDLATMGWRRANATYFESHAVDVATGMTFGMDLTPLIKDPEMDIISYVEIYINRFADDVRNLIGSMI
ncbi:MAG: PIG-L family deacetylase [Chloroflexota bacterium]|nr:PIG-L family deacetylase [Chloroflexota bacterium]